MPASEQALIFWHFTVQLLPRQSYLVYAGSACALADVPCGRSTKNQDCSLLSPLPTPHSMSNSLAIATVTATLQRLLQRAIAEDFPKAKITIVRPEASGNNTPKLGINLYLYHVSPNLAWQNSDLRTRRPKGELTKLAQAGLDLYYLMSFYGKEEEWEAQRLLGVAVRTILDNPILNPAIVTDTINHPENSILADSTLGQQVDRVTISPSNMSVEDFSKIWSVFLQTPHALSFAFQVSAVLIEGSKQIGRALPVRNIEFYTTASQPIIEQVISEAGANRPIVANSNLIIRGKQLQGEQTQIKIGKAIVTPQSISEREINLNLSLLPTEQTNSLRAGIQSLQVFHSIPKHSPLEPERAISSNVMPLALCPTVAPEVEILDMECNEDDLCSAEVRVQVDLIVGKLQRVLIFLNQVSSYNSTAYIFQAKSRQDNTNRVTFPILNVTPGGYLVRVQIDGAESPLLVDAEAKSEARDRYVGPIMVLA